MSESTIFFDKDRNVIPRWRDFRTTVALGELSSVAEFNPQWESPSEDFLEPKLRAWATNKSVPYAADVVAAAFVLRRPQEAVEAAKFLLSQKEGITGSLRYIAEQILNPTTEENRRAVLQQLRDPDPQTLQHKIHRLRMRLRDEPRNSIAYVEIARAYILLKQPEPARRAMRMAIKLAPNNRFVLRSASRLFIHTKDNDEAHNVLRNAESTKYDPWLLSAEIAVASSVNLTPRFARIGQRMIRDLSDSPFDISELTSALAKLEYSHGKLRDSRKLFRQSLVAPTDNSLAQVEWASRRMAGLEAVDSTRVIIPRNFEAQAWEHFTTGAWKEAVQESWHWLLDQPFSSRPAHLGSFVACTALEDYVESARIINRGLTITPNDPLLLNNLAFSYASSGRIEEAKSVLDRIDDENEDENTKVTVTATRGLISFRLGRISEGRSLYHEALEKSLKFARDFRAIAALYYAREEIIAGTPLAKAAFDLALKLSKDLPDVHVQAIKAHVMSHYKKLRPSTIK